MPPQKGNVSQCVVAKQRISFAGQERVACIMFIDYLRKEDML